MSKGTKWAQIEKSQEIGVFFPIEPKIAIFETISEIYRKGWGVP